MARENLVVGHLVHLTVRCPWISETVSNLTSESPIDNDESSMNFDLGSFGNSIMDQSLDQAFGKLVRFTYRTLIYFPVLGDKSGSDDSQFEGVTDDKPVETSEQNLVPKSLKSTMQKPSNSKTTPANNDRQVNISTLPFFIYKPDFFAELHGYTTESSIKTGSKK